MNTTDQFLKEIAEFTICYKPGEDTKRLVKLAVKDALCVALMAGDYKSARQVALPILDGNGLFPMIHSVGKTNHLSGSFGLGTLISWANYNDVYVDHLKVHPSEVISSIVYAVLSGDELRLSMSKITTEIFIDAVAKAYAICMKLSNLFVSNKKFVDGSYIIKIASASVNAWVLGGNENHICSAVSHAMADLAPLKLYKLPYHMTHRNIWSGADSGSRGLFHAVNAVYRGEACLDQIISNKNYGLVSLGIDWNDLKFELSNPDQLLSQLEFKIDFGCAIECHNFIEKVAEVSQSIPYDTFSKITIVGQSQHVPFFDDSSFIPSSERLHNARILLPMLLLYGKIHIDYTEDSFINAPAFKTLQRKIEFEHNKSAHWDHPLEAKVIIELDNGQTETYEVSSHKGHPEHGEKRIDNLSLKWQSCLKTGCSAQHILSIDALLSFKENEAFSTWYQNLCQLSIRHSQDYDKV